MGAGQILAFQTWRRDAIHRTRQPLGKWLHRALRRLADKNLLPILDIQRFRSTASSVKGSGVFGVGIRLIVGLSSAFCQYRNRKHPRALDSGIESG